MVAFLVGYFPSYYVGAVRDRLEQKAETYSRLVARQVESAVAFDDRATVREVFDAMAADKDIRAIALYDAAGRALFVYGEFADPLTVAPHAVDEMRTEQVSSGIRSTVPVISKEGPRGTLVLELSGAVLGEERRRAAEPAHRVLGSPDGRRRVESRARTAVDSNTRRATVVLAILEDERHAERRIRERRADPGACGRHRSDAELRGTRTGHCAGRGFAG